MALKAMWRSGPIVASLLLAAGLGGCSSPMPGQGGAGEPVTRLTATLVSPVDIRLAWSGGDPRAAGHVVEFATEPQGRYTILQILPPGQTTYTHPDLIPRTPFYYRVRPFYGPASDAVQVALPKGAYDEDVHKDDGAWASPRTVAHPRARTWSIREAASAAAARPTDLTARVMHANGIRFTWTDHASDEDGYLLEIRPAGRPDFRVAAVFDRDVNSAGLITLPDEKHASFRVRAFSYGPPSNIAHQMTGADPSG